MYIAGIMAIIQIMIQHPPLVCNDELMVKWQIVAPYYLGGTGYIDKYDILQIGVVQQYNDEVSFDFDLNVGEINALIAGRKTVYDETIAFLYDKDGYILSGF